MRVMTRIGIALIIFGAGSALLRLIDLQFKILSWAEGAQPYLGIGMAGLGVALIVIDQVNRRAPRPAPVQFAGQQFQQQPQFQPQQYAQQQFPQQQYQPAQQQYQYPAGR
ncbi:hypothetical protein [Nakamurella aerolata]|uniref:hypothetical protein n=1 Tax=Nakamurella aerolata TaxID=1656892 RepID=UPI001BB1B910|nr:hypothetical protein [Nakamurella aerolata]